MYFDSDACKRVYVIFSRWLVSINHKDKLIKVLWYFYLGGISFTLFYLLKLIVVSTLFEFLKDTESGEKGAVEEVGADIALTTAMSE